MSVFTGLRDLVMTVMKGKLTYVLVVAGLTYAISGMILGTLTTKESVDIIWACLSVFGIRRAIQQ